MSRSILTSITTGLIPLLLAGTAAALGVGDPAPEFSAESTAGTVRLADYRGERNVLLAFYFKDFTGG